ncbi:hypothetical protein [Janthinobacterium psychrotolerans]|uniref:Uncharacterized protein n=1 Tax=Janthinobacterium psychrotolerans TaxID=1747903 RepID=A0A1A7BYV9_9BURK|nr:hypothetical protein [Janthinobacterium psychrotolerans]OBV37675.1 hypothetical protein ASR47_1003338 [Janthinobacterium psychrotolerans]
MNADPRLLPLDELVRLGLVTPDEYDDALAELEIVEIQRAHNAAEGIDVSELAFDADLQQTLAWLLSEELVDTQRFFAMLQALAPQDERRQLAASALQLANRHAFDTLYQENLINQWQRDAAIDRLPTDVLIASPVAALRQMLAQGGLSPQDYQALKTRTHTQGSELARMIVDAAGKRQQHGWRAWRPSTWMILVIVLVFLALAAPGWFAKPVPAAMPPPVQTLERTDLRQRAQSAVDSARQPGADGVQYDVQVVQEKVKDEPPR